jgi:hypothetical protein
MENVQDVGALHGDLEPAIPDTLSVAGKSLRLEHADLPPADELHIGGMTNRIGHGMRLTLIAAALCLLAGCHLLGYNPDETDSHGKIQKPLPTP